LSPIPHPPFQLFDLFVRRALRLDVDVLAMI
jgi:hypothetical protein